MRIIKGKPFTFQGLRILSDSPVPADPLKTRGFEATRLGFSPHYSGPRPVRVKDTIEPIHHEDNTENTAEILDQLKLEREITKSKSNIHFPYPQQRSFRRER